ncbi:MAG: hypothetical protein GXO00_00735 [Candidatus Diapherotrites archaeon]|nr:hypothetical protein [Candidatus Diapherotrites archaeon]
MGIGERVKRAHSLETKELIYLSISQVLFGSAILVFLLLNVANALNYDETAKAFLALWGVILLVGSYYFYHRVKKSVDFLDYLASFVFFHRIRHRNKLLDATNTLLFFGILLVSVSPFIYTFLKLKGYSASLAVLSLFIGGVLIASAVSGYVLLAED